MTDKITTDDILDSIIRPLMWEHVVGNVWECGHYNILQYWPYNNGPFRAMVYRGPKVGLAQLGQHTTLAAAQAAAEADHRAKIAAALNLDLVVQLVRATQEVREDIMSEWMDISPPHIQTILTAALAAFRATQPAIEGVKE